MPQSQSQPPTASNPQPLTVTVAFPPFHPSTNEPLQFDIAYYINTHMALAERRYTAYGLLSWTVSQFVNPDPLTGEAPPYVVFGISRWASMEGFKEAMGKFEAEMREDAGRFTNVGPVIWVMEEKGRGDGLGHNEGKR